MLSNMWLKRKMIGEALLLPVIIVLVAIGAFGLGRLSALQARQDKLAIHPPVSVGGEASTAAQTQVQ